MRNCIPQPAARVHILWDGLVGNPRTTAQSRPTWSRKVMSREAFSIRAKPMPTAMARGNRAFLLSHSRASVQAQYPAGGASQFPAEFQSTAPVPGRGCVCLAISQSISDVSLWGEAAIPYFDAILSEAVPGVVRIYIIAIYRDMSERMMAEENGAEK